MKNTIKLLLLLVPSSLCAQKTYQQNVDTVIRTGIYNSYFCKETRTPLFVEYTMFNRDGNCDREKEHFSFKTGGYKMVSTDEDYSGTGYDKGHLANAEDFAYDCSKEEMTFFYYNAVPQTPKLNRGLWKSYETKLREESKTDSLYIICGGIDYNQNKYIGRTMVPARCFKIVKNLKTGTISCKVFDNDDNPAEEDITVSKLYMYMSAREAYMIQFLLE